MCIHIVADTVVALTLFVWLVVVNGDDRKFSGNIRFDALSLNVSYAPRYVRAPHCRFDEPFFDYIGEAAANATKHLFGNDVLSDAVRELGRDLGGFCFPERNAGGTAVGDFDRDGYADVVLTRRLQPLVLLRNSGPPTFAFEDVSDRSGFHDVDVDEACRRGSNGATWIDVDNDGDLDLYVTNVGESRHCLWINQGDGQFHEEAISRNAGGALANDPSFVSGGSVVSIDYDGDGFLDVYMTEWRFHFLADASFYRTTGRRSNARLLRNRGGDDERFAGHFEDVTVASGLDIDRRCSDRLARHRAEKSDLAKRARSLATRHGVDIRNMVPSSNMALGIPMVNAVPDGVFTFAPIWADFDDDGFPDLFVTGDFQTSMMFWNNGNGTFEETTIRSGLGADENGMGVAVADFDGDLRLDIFVTAIYADHEHGKRRDTTSPFGSRGNVLYRNRGSRLFQVQDVGVDDGGWGWGATWIDSDNDGDLELFMTNGFRVPESTYDDLFWNVSPNRFWIPSRSHGKGQKWIEAARTVGLASEDEGRGVALLDFNNDGYQDIIVVNHVKSSVVYENVATRDSTWFRVHVRECRACRDSIGALIYANVSCCTVPSSSSECNDNTARTTSRVSILGSSGGFLGQSQDVAHFGFGTVNESSCWIDLTVRWPRERNGERTIRTYEHLRHWNSTAIVLKTASSIDIVAPEPASSSHLHTCSSSHRISAKSSAHVRSDQPQKREVDLSCDLCVSSQHDDVPDAIQHVVTDILTRYELQRRRGEQTNAVREYRSFDGSNNNQVHSLRGASFTPFYRHFPASYEDGRSVPSGLHRPSARMLSNALFDRHRHEREDRREDHVDDVDRDLSKTSRLTELAMHFGQLLAHDLSHTTPQPNVSPRENFPIRLNNVTNGSHGGREAVMRFRRSTFTTSEAASVLLDDESLRGPDGERREQINKVTSFVDASVLYGSDGNRADALRSGRLGLLRSWIPNDVDDGTGREYPPLNGMDDIVVPNDNPFGYVDNDLFACGDVRANIQPGLLSMHTLWLREHNWIARHLLRDLASRVIDRGTNWCPCHDPNGAIVVAVLGLSSAKELDELIFQEARRIVVAEFQMITYREYLPSLLGDEKNLPWMARHSTPSYDVNVHPSVSNVVATAAFRFGHTHVLENLSRASRRRERSMLEPLSLRDAYFMKARDLLSSRVGGVDAFLRAYDGRHRVVSDDRVACADESEPPCVARSVREFLFGPDQRLITDRHKNNAPKVRGMDLIATNIQRGRDHGLPDYNTIRSQSGFETMSSMSDLPLSSSRRRSMLSDLYANDVNDIDVFVGLSMEDKQGYHLGPLTRRLLIDQFERLRTGDRFFYENEIADATTRTALEDSTSMEALLRRHTITADYKRDSPRCPSLFLV